MTMKAVAALTGCWAKARNDDHVFVLKSSDPLAPEIIREWAERYRARKTAHFNKVFEDTTDPVQRRSLVVEQARAMLKYAEALTAADDMEAQGIERYDTGK